MHLLGPVGQAASDWEPTVCYARDRTGIYWEVSLPAVMLSSRSWTGYADSVLWWELGFVQRVEWEYNRPWGTGICFGSDQDPC